MVERGAELGISAHLVRHLNQHVITIGDIFPERPEDYRLIVLWNLHWVIRDLPATRNVVVFHSSDLPQGRGWAPVYHALAGSQDEFVISAIFAASEVDSGEVIAKARFRIQSCHTSTSVRAIDEEVCIMLAAAILERFKGLPITGVPQVGMGSFYPRRRPEDNEVDISCSLVDLIPHLRACEARHPAFFDWQGCRYHIAITPEKMPGFPDDLRIEFPDETHTP